MTSETKSTNSTRKHTEKQPNTQTKSQQRGQSKKNRSRQGSRRRQRTPGKKRRKHRTSTLDKVVARFAACDRCSYFLAGYRSLFGLEHLETAVSEMDNECLTLKWSYEMQKLVQKTYGVRVDLDYYYYEGCCPRCQRQFVYWQETFEPDQADEPDEEDSSMATAAADTVAESAEKDESGADAAAAGEIDADSAGTDAGEPAPEEETAVVDTFRICL